MNKYFEAMIVTMSKLAETLDEMGLRVEYTPDLEVPHIGIRAPSLPHFMAIELVAGSMGYRVYPTATAIIVTALKPESLKAVVEQTPVEDHLDAVIIAGCLSPQQYMGVQEDGTHRWNIGSDQMELLKERSASLGIQVINLGASMCDCGNCTEIVTQPQAQAVTSIGLTKVDTKYLN